MPFPGIVSFSPHKLDAPQLMPHEVENRRGAIAVRNGLDTVALEVAVRCRPATTEQPIRVEHPAAFDDAPSAAGVSDVRQRVMVEQHKVGSLSNFETTEVLAPERNRGFQ